MIVLVAGFASALALALLVPTYADRKHQMTGAEWYKKRIRDNINIAPPGLVFPIVWPLLYLCMATAIAFWAYLQPESDWTSGRYIATWVLIGCNILFNRLWTLVFFSFRDKAWSVTLALADAFLIFGTATAIVVLFHLSSMVSWWSIGLWYAYVAWSLFAFVLNLAVWLCEREGALDVNYVKLDEMGE